MNCKRVIALVVTASLFALAAACSGSDEVPVELPVESASPRVARVENTPTPVAQAENTPTPVAQAENTPAPVAPVRILALGDSYTIGERVGKLEKWPTQLVRRLRTEGRATSEAEVIAVSGWTTSDLARAIAGSNLQGPFDVVTLLIGVNNQFRGGTVEDFEPELASLAQSAIDFAGGEADRVILISIPDWGVTPFAEGAPRTEIAMEIDNFNDAIRNRASKAGTRFVDITAISRRAASEPDLIASDGLHPSGKMYSEWVELLYPEVVELIGPSG